MNVTGLIFLGAGYLLGNPPARDKFAAALQQLAGNGIDALNKMGGGPNVPVQPIRHTQPVEPTE